MGRGCSALGRGRISVREVVVVMIVVSPWEPMMTLVRAGAGVGIRKLRRRLGGGFDLGVEGELCAVVDGGDVDRARSRSRSMGLCLGLRCLDLVKHSY